MLNQGSISVLRGNGVAQPIGFALPKRSVLSFAGGSSAEGEQETLGQNRDRVKPTQSLPEPRSIVIGIIGYGLLAYVGYQFISTRYFEKKPTISQMSHEEKLKTVTSDSAAKLPATATTFPKTVLPEVVR